MMMILYDYYDDSDDVGNGKEVWIRRLLAD